MLSLKDIALIYGISILGSLSAFYINSLFFCIFKAHKYEDQLAKKVAKEVKDA